MRRRPRKPRAALPRLAIPSPFHSTPCATISYRVSFACNGLAKLPGGPGGANAGQTPIGGAAAPKSGLKPRSRRTSPRSWAASNRAPPGRASRPGRPAAFPPLGSTGGLHRLRVDGIAPQIQIAPGSRRRLRPRPRLRAQDRAQPRLELERSVEQLGLDGIHRQSAVGAAFVGRHEGAGRRLGRRGSAGEQIGAALANVIAPPDPASPQHRDLVVVGEPIPILPLGSRAKAPAAVLAVGQALAHAAAWVGRGKQPGLGHDAIPARQARRQAGQESPIQTNQAPIRSQTQTKNKKAIKQKQTKSETKEHWKDRTPTAGAPNGQDRGNALTPKKNRSPASLYSIQHRGGAKGRIRPEPGKIRLIFSHQRKKRPEGAFCHAEQRARKPRRQTGGASRRSPATRPRPVVIDNFALNKIATNGRADPRPTR